MNLTASFFSNIYLENMIEKIVFFPLHTLIKQEIFLKNELNKNLKNTKKNYFKLFVISPVAVKFLQS